MSIYRDEFGNVLPTPAFTEFAGGILDSYYLKISRAEREVEDFRERNNRLEYDYSSMKKDRDRWQKEAEAEKRRTDAAEIKAQRLQGTIDTQATEIAKRDKGIEQYAAWRVAVREALNDLPPGTDIAALVETSDSTALVELIAVIQRVEELTKEIEGES